MQVPIAKSFNTTWCDITESLCAFSTLFLSSRNIVTSFLTILSSHPRNFILRFLGGTEE